MQEAETIARRTDSDSPLVEAIEEGALGQAICLAREAGRQDLLPLLTAARQLAR